MVNLIIPDKWQQDAVSLLRDGKDVVVQAPTGAGKTYIFELLYESLRGQAVYTVPTRALANDKLAEWKARGWDVGISTGDLAENLGARVVVATLETQKSRFLRRDGPRLLVVDEYQLLADPVRGMNYELILSLAPPETQILLLSGSIANPQDVVNWLESIGRSAVLIAHQERPVPLEEVMLSDLPAQPSSAVSGYWPRLVSRALVADLGPMLIFAPRRKAAEDLAQALTGALTMEEPLSLSQEQAIAAGEPLARLLRHRVAYHHSGLSYAVRAGIIEPLAKRGQLRAVVATMGLAAGINFSMRSVLVTGTHYVVGNFQRQVRPDELLQMFGRAGRRGLDESGYALVTPDVPRLHEACPLRLKRADPIDWPSFLAVMQVAASRKEDPFLKALELSRRLFSIKSLTVGVEGFYDGNGRPCGLRVDGERGRFVRRHEVEMRNSQQKWQKQPALGDTTLGLLRVRSANGRWRPSLTVAATLENLGFGNFCKIRRGHRQFVYGREIAVAMVFDNEWRPIKWLRKLLRQQYPLLAAQPAFGPEDFEQTVLPMVARRMGGQLSDLVHRGNLVVARFRFDDTKARGYLDDSGQWLADPETKRDHPEVCRGCEFQIECEAMELDMTPALAWRQLGLITESGEPTRRGILFSFFNHGEGLAIAAALEDPDYPVEDLVFDVGNLRAGHRFAMDESQFGGRLGLVCQQTYRRADFAGYLEMGVPPAYGAGAAEVIREVVENQTPRHKLVNELLRHGDIERAITEWRSLLRQIVDAPDLAWERWNQLKRISERFVNSTRSAALLPLPMLLPAQMKRYQSRPSLVPRFR
jgi:superfamily II DNA/RNA helicase